MIAKALSIALACASLLAWWQWSQAVSAREELSAVRLAISQQIQAETEKARAEEQRRSLKFQEAQNYAEISRKDALADAARARTSSERLRIYADQLAASCAASNPAPAASSPPADTPGDLLADMQRRIDEAAGIIAQYADESRISGKLCEQSFDALTQGKDKQ